MSTFTQFTEDFFEALLFTHEPVEDTSEDWSLLNIHSEDRKVITGCLQEVFNDNAAHIDEYERKTGRSGGHDFLMTNEGHGVGYWEHDSRVAKELDGAAKRFGFLEVWYDDVIDCVRVSRHA